MILKLEVTVSVICNCQSDESIPFLTQESIVVVELEMARTGKQGDQDTYASQSKINVSAPIINCNLQYILIYRSTS